MPAIFANLVQLWQFSLQGPLTSASSGFGASERPIPLQPLKAGARLFSKEVTMRMYSRSTLVVLLLAAVALWGADRQAGTWKLNMAKSKFTADHPAPKALTVTIQEQAGGIVADIVGSDEKGNPLHVHYTAKFDGKDYPLSGAADGSNTVSLKRVDDNTMESTNKKNGQVTTTIRSVVSADGKTRTSTWSGKDSKGNPETWTSVFDKQ
jgi:hypothetical protein